MSAPRRARQAGASVVEFAIMCGVFVTLLLGIMEVSRILFYWNTATELTRLGARMAAVCSVGETAIAQRIVASYPLIPLDKVQVIYTPNGCTAANCTAVTVKVDSGVAISAYIPFVPINLSLPEFRTTLPRESLASSLSGAQNPVCAP